MQNRVLLVEDDEELRSLLARYLTGQGFEVREAENGATASRWRPRG